MPNRILITALLFVTIALAPCETSIVYHPGLHLLHSYTLFPPPVDVDQDGTADYRFFGYNLASLPSIGFPSILTPCVDTISLNANDYLTGASGGILLKQAGAVFGPETGSEEQWRHHELRGQPVSRAYDNAWIGFSGSPPQCFVGLRFTSEGERHYGWIRLLVPSTQHDPSGPAVFPLLADWAYEAQPNTAIRAGDVGANDDPLWFTVDFQNPSGTLHTDWNHRSTGAGVLTGSTFRYHFILGGGFEIAKIRGPAPAHSKAKPAWDLAPPCHSLGICLPENPDPTIPEQPAENCIWISSEFFGELTVSTPQAMHLRRGTCFVTVENGALFGHLVPAVEGDHRCDW